MGDTRLSWCRSRFCSNSACLEVAREGGMILLKASSTPNAAVKITLDEFKVFLAGAKAGDFDALAS